MNKQRFHEENGAGWNITAAIYERDEAEVIALLRAGGTSLMPAEVAALGDLAPWCGRAIHLQCAGGADTLSLLHHGARAVLGVDISPRMIDSARRKTLALGANAEWLISDVLAIPEAYNGTANLVHTGRGALCWMMDLDAWAATVARLLKPGGRLHVFEGHPLDWVWDVESSTYTFSAIHPGYFNTAVTGAEIWPMPFIERAEGIDPAAVPMHDRQWTLGQVINAVIRAGLTITYFNEYPEPFWNQFEAIPEDLIRRLPHTYTLMAEKKDSGE
jgi:SAM-dependent methyltransferase